MVLNFFESIDWADLALKSGEVLAKLIGIYIAYIIVKSIGNKIIHKMFEGLENRKEISTTRAKTLQTLVLNFFHYALFFIFIVTVFQVFGYNVTALLAGAGVVGLAIGFGAQGLVSDVVTGFFLLLEKQLDVGDYVTTGNYSGIVEAVGLRTTQIRGFDGTLHYVPNRQIVGLSNHSRGNMQALVDISISYNEDLNRVMSILQEACDQFAKETEEVVEGPDVLGVQNFGTSDVIIRIIAKTKNMEQWAVERKLRKRLKEVLDENGIEIPFPHQVMIHKNEQQKERG
ncbi:MULTISPECIES: mechanosensitive ion channel family protein [Aeribacillus]|jgi:moderate conductance mechanosensitive channel|uniref:mechanosensitive ion channel family protein n=1 Tax=Aeribacillus TaxID=1055323 RepID=UPI0007B4EDA1|nr:MULTISPECIES: mechanosensitive ion channel family protein [Aeribacillus]REJ26794.1 MAG: mechanosensitive ion channel family protein [Bacillaceae bacterium]KZM56261.1 mechanosensitive ion channel protein [Aeribacillus pallidus]MED0652179.1 mechanosensitive ion channel family protein [Aeribacillus composti]MED0701524.1 mechanosensitive ion channel family protein [Aeribacillus composti]MED0717190.1 mechanosensitive ion channel family protein [Aeribacillus composti]